MPRYCGKLSADIIRGGALEERKPRGWRETVQNSASDEGCMQTFRKQRTIYRRHTRWYSSEVHRPYMCRLIDVCDVLTKSKRNKCFTFASLHLWSIMTGVRNTLSCVLNTVHQRWTTKWPNGISGLASMNKIEIKNSGAKIFQNSSSQLKIPGARQVTRSKFHIEGSHILGTTNSVITTTRRPRFRHPWCIVNFCTTKTAIQKVDPSAKASETYSGSVWFEPHTGQRLPFLRFLLSSAHHSQCRESTAITSRNISSTSFPVHCSLIVPTPGANPSEIQRRQRWRQR
jgi:hypothetical protein